MITDARSLWELIERRADETPDAPCAVDEDQRTLTFGEYRDAVERAAAGLAELGVGAGTAVSWQLPTWLESLVLVGALARLGAVQNPILPIYREREVGFVTQQTGAELLIVPSEWKGFDYEAMARAIADGSARARGADRRQQAARRRPGDAAAADATVAPDDAAQLPVRWVFYTSGTTADPKGAHAHRPHDHGVGVRHGDGARDRRPTTSSALVFPFTHIGGIGWLFATLMSRLARRSSIEAFDPADDDPGAPTRGRHARRRGHAVPHGVPRRAARAAGRRRCSRRCARSRAAARRSRRSCTTTSKEELGGVGVVSGYGLTECPILTMAAVRRPRREARRHRGPRDARRRGQGREARRDGRGAGRGGRDPGQGPAAVPRLRRRVARRRRLRRGRLLPHRRPRQARRRRLHRDHGPAQGRDHPQGREHQRQGGRGPAVHAPRGRRRRRDRAARRRDRASVRARSSCRPTRRRRRRSKDVFDFCSQARAS